MTKWSPQTSSDLQKIRRSNNLEMISALQDLLNRGEALEQAAEIIEQRLINGGYITNQELAKLLSITKRASLYELTKDQIFGDVWALSSLYRSGYPDAKIEERLCEILYDIAARNDEPRRSEIVGAMRDVGSLEVLPVLEAILFDLLPMKSTKNAIANALSTSGPSAESILAAAVSNSVSSFIRLVAEAVDAVRARDSKKTDSSIGCEANVPNEHKVVANAHAELQKAREYVESDPIHCMVCLRRGAESMGKHLYRHLGLEKGARPANKMMLDDLQKPIRESSAPEIFKIFMQAVQPFGNYAAHDQDDMCTGLNSRVSGALLVLYEEALREFEQWVLKSNPTLE